MRFNCPSTVFLVGLLLAANCYADTIYLKDGKIIKAKITAEDEKTILIETDTEWKRIEKDDVKGIDKSNDDIVQKEEEKKSEPQKSQKNDNPIGGGSIRLSGSLSIGSTQRIYNGNGNGTVTTETVSPKFGYFLFDGFSVGPEIQLVNESSSGATDQSTGYGLGITKYFGNKNSSILTHIGVSGLITKYTNTGYPNASGSIIMPNLGMDIMISHKASIAILLNYIIETYKYDTSYYYYYNNYSYSYINNRDTYGNNTIQLALEVAIYCF